MISSIFSRQGSTDPQLLQIPKVQAQSPNGEHNTHFALLKAIIQE